MAVFGEESVTAIIRLLSTQFLLMCFATIPRSLILRKMDFKKLSIIDFTSGIFGSLITLGLALTNYGVWSLVWGTLAYNICNVVMLNLMSPFLHLPRFSLKGMKRIMSFGGYVTLNGILWFFFTRTDIFIVGKLLGKGLLGFYSVGSNFSKLPMEKISPIISEVIFPAFARIQDDRRMAGAYFLKAVRITSLVAFPILWGVSSIASELVDILLGGKWQPSTVPIRLLSLVVPLFMIRNMLIPIMMGMGRADIAFFNSLFGAILLPLSILIGIRWGLIGVSLAWVIVLPLVLWENLLVTVPVLGITVSEVFGAMVKSFLAAVSMYAAIMAIKGFLGLDPKSVGYLVLLIITGVTVYVGMIVVLHEKGCREVLAVVKDLRISK